MDDTTLAALRASDQDMGDAALDAASLIVALAGVAVPGAGMLGLAISQWKLSRSSKRWQEFTRAVETEFRRLNTKIEGTVQRDEFETFFHRVSDNVVKEHWAEKFRAYKNFMVNTAVIDKPGEQKELILHVIEGMSTLHLRVFTTLLQMGATARRSNNTNEILGTHLNTIELTAMPIPKLLSTKLGISTVQVHTILRSFEAQGLLWPYNDQTIEKLVSRDATKIPNFISDFAWEIHKFASEPTTEEEPQ